VDTFPVEMEESAKPQLRFTGASDAMATQPFIVRPENYKPALDVLGTSRNVVSVVSI